METTQHLKQAFLSKGFKYLKVELEAQVSPDDYSQDTPCENCSGEGRIECSECSGSGTVERDCETCEHTGHVPNDEAEGEEEDCSDCNGTGMITEDCGYCNESTGYYRCEDCNDGYITPSDWEETYCEDFECRFREELNGIDEHFKFLKVYVDGSCDTEATITLRVDYISELPTILKAFKTTCHHFGSCDTENAGLHITLLEGYQYPRTRKLNQAKLSHYKEHVGKLLFGLVYLGSVGDKTRSFNFRDIQISDTCKYSAIYTHADTCIEYRLFDCCYDEPERILSYLSVIVKTLRYYTDNEKKAVPIRSTVPLETTDKILKKKHTGQYANLIDVFQSRQSRMRLFNELFFLLDAKGRELLADIAQLNPCSISPKLFTLVNHL